MLEKRTLINHEGDVLPSDETINRHPTLADANAALSDAAVKLGRERMKESRKFANSAGA